MIRSSKFLRILEQCGTISKFGQAGFFKFVLVIESRVFKVGKIVDVIRSKKNSPDLDETWYVGRG